MSKLKFYFCTLMIIKLLDKCAACENYKIRVSDLKNCGDDNQIIKITENSTIKVNENCEVFSYMCADVGVYKTAEVRIVFKDSTMVLLNRTETLCNGKKKLGEFEKILMAVTSIKCDAIKETSFCDDGSKVLSLSSSLRKLIKLAARDEIKIRNLVKHDTGSSCFEGTLRIKKRQ